MSLLLAKFFLFLLCLLWFQAAGSTSPAIVLTVLSLSLMMQLLPLNSAVPAAAPLTTGNGRFRSGRHSIFARLSAAVSAKIRSSIGSCSVFIRVFIWLAEGLLMIFFPLSVRFFALFAFDGMEEFLSRKSGELRLLAPLFLLPALLRTISIHFSDFAHVEPRSLAIFFFLLSLSLFLAWICEKEWQKELLLRQTRDHLAEESYALRRKLRKQKEALERQLQLTRLDERQRIARELHDVIGHTLTSALLQTGAIRVLNHDPAIEAPLQRLSEHLHQGMTETRKSLHDLNRSAFDLRARVEILLAGAEGFRCKLHFKLDEDCPLEIQCDILAAVREAVTNAMRHSGGDQIELSILAQPAFYAIRVRDNGKDAAAKLENWRRKGSWAEGIGLNSLEDIAARHHGALSLDGREGFSLHLLLMKETEQERVLNREIGK